MTLNSLLLFILYLSTVESFRRGVETIENSRYVTLSSGRTKYRIFGTNNPIHKRIVTIHGLLGCGEEYNRWRGTIVGRGYHLLQYDLVGHGLSEWRIKGLLKIDDFVKQLRELLVAIGWTNSKIILIGLSLGGLISVNYSVKYPEHIESLILLAPAGIISRYDSPNLYKLSKIFSPSLAKNIHKYPIFLKTMKDFLNLLGIISSPYDPYYIMKWSTIFKIGLGGRLFERYDDYKRLAKIKDMFPILFIWGGNDLVLPLKFAFSFLKANFPESRIVILPFTSHVLTLGSLSPINIALEFLEKTTVGNTLESLNEESNEFQIIEGIKFRYTNNSVIYQINTEKYLIDDYTDILNYGYS
ncbi:hydrolase, alpha/beta fold family protein [Cryptosporidium muris RN66]|uniref:Hydrolase, alpha/beta fold family protein n=1 Tax=Cryptosporidium muris (strain RN66) TaxID=441375 RepID=B6AAA7_CRYMR|nr:hydrolase, alpha/beta fold family protein [Cryptosporidium muris RN66]EEA05148.1 hydrolase, alpha/beta fold family protein [Cryptosporidium muris RN66]|eukprot:XP_002139497.1 hydrolase, alpha/beta fold family protein [Cryptosporidium muris RN66]